ncbi:MAG: TRAP transporter small permease subunit [Pseudomonadota bacterium]
MRAIADLIDGFNEYTGRFLAWFTLAIVLIQFAVVVGRYVFGVGAIFYQELIIYLHAFLFMLAASYTLKNDGHVRVDVFYREASPRRKAMINLLGSLLLLIPVCLLIIWISWPYVERSWAIRERSMETSGIPFVYILKTAIIGFAVMVGLQGVSMALRSLLAIGGDERELDRLRHHTE